MSADQFVFLFAALGVVLFVFGPGWVRQLRAWFRPEPLAPYRYPGFCVVPFVPLNTPLSRRVCELNCPPNVWIATRHVLSVAQFVVTFRDDTSDPLRT